MLKSIIGKILGIIGRSIVVELSIGYLLLAECSSTVTYYVAKCSVRVTALLEYLDHAFKCYPTRDQG